ncbi:GNAT family N-acetyltransferase [Hymenobacter cellulosilyticus]|uniref:GNAT family N-acetyltransferase n=1 Tax=Hymenobacter cellulosilyticus TaxID=2932248 RepID=A0A8T9Q8I3_9BACT|nr:GNAT family N-acetyltransferase [Hymenobacter cellulosilyticus]UOQ72398.1 GNAT family N-acetyltransferase [Hymenobacter cellulosilyticus]
MNIVELPPAPARTPIRTPRLTLRPYVAADAEAFFAVIDQERARLQPAFPSRVAAVQTLDDARQVLQGYTQDWSSRRLLVLGIWHTASGAYLGDISLKPVWSRAVTAEIGYYLAADAEGHGYAQEALEAAVVFGFRAPLGATRLDIRCYATNPRSCAVAERAGFRRLPAKPRLWPRKTSPKSIITALRRPLPTSTGRNQLLLSAQSSEQKFLVEVQIQCKGKVNRLVAQIIQRLKARSQHQLIGQLIVAQHPQN